MQPLRIGTRGSHLALWQASQVENALQQQGFETLTETIRTQGDQDQLTPLDRFPERGVFTKAIDQAVLDGHMDLAVHSLKDLPVILPEGIILAAVLPRDHWADVLITKSSFHPGHTNCIATSSSRRKAQWKARYPLSRFVDIRGNMEVRLQKFAANAWDGLILSKAGLDRIGLLPKGAIDLEWMVPAPGQGVIGVTCREDDVESYRKVQGINDPETWICIGMERHFMQQIEMACQAPVGALALISDGLLTFTGSIHSPEGLKIWQRSVTCPVSEAGHHLPDLCLEAKHHVLKSGL
ncbi:MAG: hydroxymethylbilane synthase [Saprospiraceae bacterium]|nr:hydroxymethylbilane synthase [Saprospiraceae bacterium]MCB9320582.1 hydroxymethylbilane synthase [Lewinellaceae bacterium]